MDLITVILNVYNGEKYIKKCLDSIINQTYKNLEILVINDGSNDNTLSILNGYKDKRIKVITTENQGLSLSRNVGIDSAKGEYLYFIDADDFIDNDTIEYLYNLCKKHDAFMSTCNSIYVYNYDQKIKNKKEKIDVLSGKDLLKKILLANSNDGTTWNKLYKKELFNDIRFEDRIINDIVVTYKIAMKLDKYVYSNQIKYFYLRHSDSIMSMHKSKRDIDFYKGSIERYNDIKKVYPDLVENDICMEIVTILIYEHNNKESREYLEEVKAKELYDKLFKIKFIFYKIGFKRKIKLILYRISPKLLRKVLRQ